jgi:hypothetical protein
MKNKAGLLIPLVLILFGAYALFNALSSGGEQVTLMSDHQIPRGLAIVFGLIGVGGGGFVILNALSGKRHASS